jgi:hypothetical protein
MKRLTLVLAAVAVAFYLGGIPALAQHGHSGGTGHGPSAGGPSGHPGSGSDPGKPSSPNTNSSVSTRLAHNDKLADKLEKLTGMSSSQLQSACSKFKNLGQCVAAVHVWHNLNLSSKISFADWAKLVESKGLGKAIQTEDPGANAKAEAKKGQRQANDDLKESSS